MGCGELFLVAFLSIGIVSQWLKPLRMYRCAPQAGDLAQCLVADRLFGLVPIREQLVAGIARSEAKSREVSEGRDRDGRLTATATREEELALFGAEGRQLWSMTEDHIVGASLVQVDADVRAIVSGERKDPALRIQAYWPVLLLSSVFVLLSLGTLVSQIGKVLRDRDLIPSFLYTLLFAWSGLLISLALVVVSWTMVLLGSDPPAVVARLAGLA